MLVNLSIAEAPIFISDKAGVSVTAEKPLIYDKIDNIGAGADPTYQVWFGAFIGFIRL